MGRVGRQPVALASALGVLLALDCYAQLPHERLGVSIDAPPAELKKAYRKRCLQLHPDKHKGEAAKAWAEKEFMALGKAYEKLLADAVRRYQGASSRPTRAGTGAAGGTRGEGRGQSPPGPQADSSRQTEAARLDANRARLRMHVSRLGLDR